MGCAPFFPKSQVYHIDGQPLLNGLFGVKKDEIVNGIPVHRLIMDLGPCNNVCRGLEGDVAPPCQGVSGLNADRRGALRDHRSSLFIHVERIRELVRQKFKWAQVRYLADSQDRKVMTMSFGDLPAQIDASGVSLARRPRLYWCNWDLRSGHGVSVGPLEGSGDSTFRKIELMAEVTTQSYLQPGCSKASTEPFPTFTTSRPRNYAGRRPAGLDKLSPQERLWWEEDSFRFPPYQYQEKLMIVDAKTQPRLPDIQEREVIIYMGFPKDYTMQCMPKQWQGSPQHLDERKTYLDWQLVECHSRHLADLAAWRTVGVVLIPFTSTGCRQNSSGFLF